MKKFFRITVLFLSAFLVTSCGGQKAGAVADEKVYSTSVLQTEDVFVENIYPATVKGREDIEIRPRIDGFIEEIYVDEGSKVKKGQRLFRVDSPQAIQSHTTANAGIESAKAQVSTAKTNVDRIRPLAEKGIIGEVQLSTAEDAYQTALAGLEKAEAARRNASATLSWTEVVSPVDGYVGEIPYRLGSLVNSANVLTTVSNTSSVYANFSLNEKELASFLEELDGNTQEEKIAKAPEVTLITANGKTYYDKGRIVTISGSLNPRTGSANIRAEFANEDGRLRSGASGKVAVRRELKNVFIIPQIATFAIQNKTILYVVNDDDTVSQKVVEVVPMPDGVSYAVVGGLKSGERIVTDGIVTLREGAKINTDQKQQLASK